MTLIYLKINYIIFILYSKDLQDLSSLFTLHALFHLFTLYFYFFCPIFFPPTLCYRFFLCHSGFRPPILPITQPISFFSRAGLVFEVIIFSFSSSLPPHPLFFSWSTIIKKYSFGGDTFMVTPLEKAV